MRRSTLWRVLVALGVVGAVLLLGPTWAGGVAQHGIGFTKGCEDPTVVGEKTTCSFTFFNSLQTESAGNSVEFHGMDDLVFSAGGTVSYRTPLGHDLLPDLDL